MNRMGVTTKRFSSTIFPKPLRFRLNIIREIEELSIAENDDGENMSRKLSKDVTERD